MSEIKTNICPCCSKGCDLSAPRCSRGEEYLKTGIIPEKGNRGHREDCHSEEHRHADRHHEDRRPNYEEMSIDEKLSALLSRLGRAGHGTSDGKNSQNRILHILSKTEHMTQRELTEQLGIRPGSASEIIKKLETAGLITRQSNSEDRRTVDIALTDAGRAQAEASSAQSGNAALFDSLTEEEKQQLLSLLEKLGQDWHNRFHGEGRGEHKHHEKGDGKRDRGGKHDRDGEHGHDAEHGRRGKHDRKEDHGRDGKHGRDSEHGHGGKHGREEEKRHDHKQGRGHHHEEQSDL